MSGSTAWLIAVALAAALALALLLVQLAYRAGRRRAPEGPSSRLPGLESGASAHRRVRLAIYVVLLAAAGHAALLAWQADASLQRRQAETEAANLAGMQRMHSQRIGRIASLLGQLPGEQLASQAELRAVLERADRDARVLQEFLYAGSSRLGSALALDAAVLAGWEETRTALYRQAEALLQAAPQRGSARVATLQQAVEPALLAAERLVLALEQATEARQRSAVTLAKVWAAATVSLLIALAVIVAEPTARAVRSQYLKLATQARELERLALVAELTTNAVMITDGRQRLVWVNEAFSRLTGYRLGEALGHSMAGLLQSQPTEQAALARLQTAVQAGRGARAQVLNRRKDGRELWLDIDMQPLRDSAGAAEGFVAVAADVTERRRAQADLRIAAIAFDSLEAIAITDAAQSILRVNPAFTRITGYSAAEAHGRVVGRLLRSGRHEPAFYEAMWRQLSAERHWQGEVWNRRKNGQVYPEWLSITAVTDEDGAVANYVAVFTDITQKKLADETIHNLAFYDALTELPNRRLMRDRLGQVQASSVRHLRPAAVLFIDLDHFKELNDTRGHDVGDRLLVEVARRLQATVRVNDTVARQGGDEFVVILPDLSETPEQAAVDAETVAEKVRAVLTRPYALDEHEWHSTASIGISMLYGNEVSLDEILKRADIAMYEAKRSGRNAIRFFDPATHAAMAARIALEADLRHALPQGEFRLHYQLQVDQWRQPVGAEVLLRWQHPRRGMVAPGSFIALAEDTDLISPIGHWVLREACQQLRRWADAPATRELQLAVNVSARQFRQIDFVEQVRGVLESSGANPRLLKLELTESLVLVNLADTLAKMQAINALGVRFAIDDFGTGQSSLAYLTRLSLDQLKIDQTFVASMLGSHTDAVIVQTIIGMAKSLGLEVIAEGVETEEQLAFLVRNGCRRFQGYLLGRPVPIEQLEQQLAVLPGVGSLAQEA